jgi:hypothetical protein
MTGDRSAIGRRNAAKGGEAERAVAKLLREQYGLPAHRGLAGSLGYEQACDIALPGCAIEVRDRKVYGLGYLLATMGQLAERNPSDLPLLIMKPTGISLADVDRWFALTYVGDLFDRFDLGQPT